MTSRWIRKAKGSAELSAPIAKTTSLLEELSASRNQVNPTAVISGPTLLRGRRSQA